MRTYQSERLAGVVLLFGFVYIVAEFIAAGAWVDPSYDWARNFISDLGFSDCAVVDGDRICSPLHALMNAGFMVQGAVFAMGALLIIPVIFPSDWRRNTVAVLMAASGVGTFLVGVFHQSLALYDAGLNGLHYASAFLAIGAGDIGLVLFGVLALPYREWRPYAIGVLVVGVVGIVGAVLLFLRIDLGLGIGTIERIAVYPLNAWTIGSGIGLTVKSLRFTGRWSRHVADEQR